MNTTQKLTFVLAGEMVPDAAHANRVVVDAIHKGEEWLMPQVEYELRRLRVQAQ